MKTRSPLSVVVVMFSMAVGCGTAIELEQNEGSVSQAIGPGIGQGQVQITEFDRHNLQLVGVVGPIAGNEARIVELRFGPAYETRGEDYTQLSFPDDAVLPEGKCGDTAEKWIWALSKDNWDDEKKHAHVADELLSKLARDHCSVDIDWVDGQEAVKNILEMGFPASLLGSVGMAAVSGL